MDTSSIYEKQIFFDLRSNMIVMENDAYSWDIAFDCRPGQYSIIINPAKMMTETNLGQIAITDEYISGDTLSCIDKEDGNLDSTAIGKWWASIEGSNVKSKGDIYLLNMGINQRGKKMGYKRLVINGYNNDKYSFTFADKDGNNPVQAEIAKTGGVHFIYFSFQDTSAKMLEPPKDSWDLLLTRYTHYYGLEGYELYGVNGVLLNRENVKALQLHTDKEFNDIKIEDVTGELSTRMDTIGFDWKYFDLDKSQYVVKTKKYYIIQDYEGFLYKFHFLDFYNKNGDQGYPTFEFQKL